MVVLIAGRHVDRHILVGPVEEHLQGHLAGAEVLGVGNSVHRVPNVIDEDEGGRGAVPFRDTRHLAGGV